MACFVRVLFKFNFLYVDDYFDVGSLYYKRHCGFLYFFVYSILFFILKMSLALTLDVRFT